MNCETTDSRGPNIGELEGTMTFVMDECIVPSIRRENNQLCNGGLEALKDLFIIMYTVLPIVPLFNTLSVDP